MYAVLAACWQPPQAPVVVPGVEITARFSLRRNGGLVGPPRITYTAGVGALQACMPARITRGLGRAVAGHPVALRLVYRPPA